MTKTLERRIQRLEERQTPIASREGAYSGLLGNAIRIAFALATGANAKAELAEAGASLKPEHRAELEEHLAAARSIPMTLEAAGPPREMPLSAATVLPRI